MGGDTQEELEVGGGESGNDLNSCMKFSNKIIKYIY